MVTKQTRKTEKPAVDEAIFRKASVGGYLPSEQYADVEFRAKDAPEDAATVKVKIRTDVTNDEIEALPKVPDTDARMTHHWAQVAPLVLGWNVQHRAEDGVVYDVAPPAEAGPDVFKYVPNPLFWQINAAIISRGYERITPKSLAESATTEDS